MTVALAIGLALVGYGAARAPGRRYRTVLAGVSLKAVFATLRPQFEAAHPTPTCGSVSAARTIWPNRSSEPRPPTFSLPRTTPTGGERYESVAATLGATPLTVLRRITVPLVLPGLGSGTVLSFARCLGEFGAAASSHWMRPCRWCPVRSAPDLLLLDEPLSAVDVELAPALRSLLQTVLANRIALIVTHQVIDALVLADRVVALDGGRVVEQGATREVLTRPRSAFGARLAGLNLVAGTATEAGLRADDGTELSGLIDSTVHGARAVAVFPPSAVAVHLHPLTGSPRNVIRDRVAALEPNGTMVRVRGAAGLAVDVAVYPT
ncbi:MAG: hypothetical protein DLM62_17795 [Pseudonocardiales bacterium]|nr:MAG: hypothetical protein DLM62_17795 [Pseudonocardiales bacterium]